MPMFSFANEMAFSVFLQTYLHAHFTHWQIWLVLNSYKYISNDIGGEPTRTHTHACFWEILKSNITKRIICDRFSIEFTLVCAILCQWSIHFGCREKNLTKHPPIKALCENRRWHWWRCGCWCWWYTHTSRTLTTIRTLHTRLSLDKTKHSHAIEKRQRNMCCIYIYICNQGRRRRRRFIQDIAFNMFRSNTKMCFALLCVTFTCVIYWSYKFAHNDKYAAGPKDDYEWIWWQMGEIEWM